MPKLSSNLTIPNGAHGLGNVALDLIAHKGYERTTYKCPSCRCFRNQCRMLQYHVPPARAPSIQRGDEDRQEPLESWRERYPCMRIDAVVAPAGIRPAAAATASDDVMSYRTRKRRWTRRNDFQQQKRDFTQKGRGKWKQR